MDLTSDDAIKRLLAEAQIDAPRALGALIRTLVDGHLRAEELAQKKLSAQIKPVGGLVEPEDDRDVLEHVLDTIKEDLVRNTQFFEAHDNEEEPDNDLFMAGLMCGNLAALQEVLLDVLYACRDIGHREVEQARIEAELLAEVDPTTVLTVEGKSPKAFPPLKIAD